LARTILLIYQKHFEDDQQLLVDPHKQYANFSILDQHFDPQYELGNYLPFTLKQYCFHINIFFSLDNFVYDLDFKSTEVIYKQFSREILKSKCKRFYFSNYDLDEMADDEDECGKNLTYLKKIGS